MTGERLVLFDIDGTLLDCGGQTREVMAQALEQTYGTSGKVRSNGFAGKTDDQIVFEALAGEGVSEREIGASLMRAKRLYVGGLRARLDAERVQVLPGVLETLGRLGARPDVRLGLLTGNWQLGARCKLESAGLGDRFGFGAFGDRCRERSRLPPVALAAARRRFGRVFAPDDALIVGDTPNDVACGRAHGIAVVGVATGTASREELEAAGATHVCETLADAAYLESVLDLRRAL